MGILGVASRLTQLLTRFVCTDAKTVVMRLNILSDLHLSQGELPWPNNNADLVILAGDIARPAKAIAWAAGITKPVLYVPGNHEFYNSSVSSALAELKQRCIGSNITILDNDAVIIDGVRFLGTTLWTDFLLYGDGVRRSMAIEEALRHMYDFSRIEAATATAKHLTPMESVDFFNANSAWLEYQFVTPWAGPTVVITHHAPSPKSIHPRFSESLLNPCFVSNAEHLVAKSDACLWVHGHTHDSFDYVLHQTRVVCNPRGYARDGINENARFDMDLIVTV
jgi:predicted phosphodiesterase